MVSTENQPFVCLDMYSWPETLKHWQAFWSAIRAELAGATELRELNLPAYLTIGRDPYEMWTDTNLFLGHTCGWPYISKLRGKVSLVGRFDHQLANCVAGDYDSVLIAPKGTKVNEKVGFSSVERIAVNGLDSQSGYRVLSQFPELPIKKIELNRGVVVTGSHRDSIIAIGKGQAELAAIDAVTWRMAVQHEAMADQVEIVGRSRPTPGLPIITSLQHELHVAVLFDCIKQALMQLPAQTKQEIGCYDFVPAHDRDYDILQ